MNFKIKVFILALSLCFFQVLFAEIEEDFAEVDFLGLVIDGDRPEKSLEELYHIAIKYDFDLGPVYYIDNLPVPGSKPRKILDDYGDKLTARGGRFQFMDRPPERLQVTTWPAFLVATRNSKLYILEGVSSITKYFNSSGKLNLNLLK